VYLFATDIERGRRYQKSTSKKTAREGRETLVEGKGELGKLPEAIRVTVCQHPDYGRVAKGKVITKETQYCIFLSIR